MEPVEKGTLVLSLAGRDKGRLLAAVGSDDRNRILVCDGKERKIERPKSKNIRHLKMLEAKLDEDALRSNRALRKALVKAEVENSGGN
ncbi:MAG: KOW domain-containing RNA-binding protein [Clostridia bacterium]|nr:KOW domain-containing RNA-binding protein [Clostridia bacterium]